LLEGESAVEIFVVFEYDIKFFFGNKRERN